jgi:PAS domain S-box-containing protein
VKIGRKILIIALSLVLISGLSGIVINQTVSKNILASQVYSDLESTAQSRADHINTFVEQQKNLVLQLSQSVVIERLLITNKAEEDYDNRLSDVTRRLMDSADINEEIYDIFVLNLSGEVIASNIEERVGLDRSDDPYFINGQKGVYLKDPYFSRFFENQPSLAISAPVIEKATSDLLGVVVIRIKLDSLNDITIDRTWLGKTGEIYLINENNYMITPSRFVNDAFLKQKVDTPESREWLELSEEEEELEREEIDIYESYYGEIVIGTHHKIEGAEWCLLAEMSEEEALPSVARLTSIMILSLTALLFIDVILSILISRTITRPIVKLHQGAEQIMKGNLDYKVGTKARDEVGQLSRQFDIMTVSLKESRAELEEHSQNLEKLVGERTAELEERIKESERQRVALINIAQELDVTNANLLTEMTERKRAEEELEIQRARLKSIFDYSLEGIVTLDINNNILDANLGFENIYGYEIEEVKAKRIDDLIVPEFFYTEAKKLDQMALGGILGYETIRKRKDGTELNVSISAGPVKIGGEFRGRFIIFRDITERKRAEEALRESEARFRELADLLPQIVYETDVKGSIIFANRIAFDSFGYAQEDIDKGLNALQMFIPEDTDRAKENIGRIFSGEKLGGHEYIARTKDGRTFPVETYSNLIIHENKPVGLRGIMIDTTERKQAEEEREALLKDLEIINRKLEESNRELQDFVYVASHDLREPLRKITSFGTLLQDSLGGKLDEDQLENFEFMIDGSKRMQTMIDDLLLYSRVTTKVKPFQQVNLNSVIEDLKNLELAVLLDETRGTIRVPEMLPPVQGDSSQLHQLLQNLVGNGLKFHREGVLPEITIHARRIENDMVRVEVKDNGIGIGKEYYEQVFTMFKRLHSRTEYQGTGIGLAVCKKIVQRHGGEIGVESTLGEGSIFWFTLHRGSY